MRFKVRHFVWVQGHAFVLGLMVWHLFRGSRSGIVLGFMVGYLFWVISAAPEEPKLAPREGGGGF